MSIGTSASAYDWNRSYGANAGITRNDNFRLSEIDPVANTATRVGVFADLRGTTEISSLDLTAGASADQNSASSVDDSTDYYLTLASTRRGERWSGNLNLSYRVESTAQTELLDTGVLGDGERKSSNIGSGVKYQLDERNSIYANLSFSTATYDTVSLNEYSDNSLSLGWVNQLSEISDISINGSVSNYEPDVGDKTTVNSLQFGYGVNTSAATRYDLLLGYSESDSPTGTTSDGHSSIAVDHSIDERNNFSLFLGSGYVASGSGEVRYQDELKLGWNHALAERTQFKLTASGVRSDERDYIGIVAGASHQYTREFSVAANYEYRNQQSDIADADSNSVSLSLSYSLF